MNDLIIKKLRYDLTSNAGLALVGQYVKHLDISAVVHPQLQIGVAGVANSDILNIQVP